MKRRRDILGALHVVVAVSLGCAASGRPFDPSLQGQHRFLCSTLRFNENGDATDANYAYPLYGQTLPVGTRVTVGTVAASYITFTTKQGAEYSLEFSYGREHLTAAGYFGSVLCAENPARSVDGKPEEMRRAIRQGRLIRGMTKEEAILTRGHPPAHRTPDERSDEWIYFQSPGFVDRVRFLDGRISAIETDRAP